MKNVRRKGSARSCFPPSRRRSRPSDRTPAGRARLAYKRGHQLFQYELEVNGLEPTVVPGHIGSPALETTDPVDILNSVTVEGWKLVSGKFLHSEMRNGAVGCYLFKRSQKSGA